MSSPGPGNKRRRLDNAASALHKPFRSPLKTTITTDDTSKQASSPNSSPSARPLATATRAKAVSKTPGSSPRSTLYKPYTPSHLAQTTAAPTSSSHLLDGPKQYDEVDEDIEGSQDTPMKRQRNDPPLPRPPIHISSQQSDHPTTTPSSSFSSSTALSSAQSSQRSTHSTSTPHKPASRRTTKTALQTPSHKSSSSSPRPQEPDDLQALEKAVRALESEARTLRTQISTLRQAKGLPDIVSSTTTTTSGTKQDTPDITRLTTLIQKWKLVSQSAADQVFDDVAARFKDLGGMGAYHRQQREHVRQREKEDWALDFETAVEAGIAHGDKRGGEEERTRQKLACAEREEMEEKEEEEEEEKEQEFGMQTMLAMLHIDPDLIGWDCEREMWIA